LVSILSSLADGLPDSESGMAQLKSVTISLSDIFKRLSMEKACFHHQQI